MYFKPIGEVYIKKIKIKKVKTVFRHLEGVIYSFGGGVLSTPAHINAQQANNDTF